MKNFNWSIAALLAGAFLWSQWLAWRIAGHNVQTTARRALAAAASACAIWAALFWRF